MNISNFKRLLQYFYYFKNPFSVLKLHGRNIVKGKKIKIVPRRGEPFFVGRGPDIWLINKIIFRKGKVNIVCDKESGVEYILEDGFYLRQGTSDTFIYKEIMLDRDYELCLNYLNKESLVIDLGAHIGLFSIFCSPFCRKILAYEAHPENYQLALKNIKSKSAGNVSVENLAAWSLSGEYLKIDGGSGFQTGDFTVCSVKMEPKELGVKTISLDEIFSKEQIDFCDLLKIDIEGAEYCVLMSAPKNVFEKIGNIYMEYHADSLNKNTISELEYFLKKMGFMVNIKPVKENVGYLYAKNLKRA